MKKCIYAMLICFVALPCVQAGFLDSSENTQAAIKGSSDYSYSKANYVLSGSIEFSVYDRLSSNYSNAFADVLGAEDNGRYIYAYQIFNDTGANNVAVDYFAVGVRDAKVYQILTSGETQQVDVYGEYFSSSEGPDEGSTAGTDENYAATFNFAGKLGSGEESFILIFTSDNAWQFVTGDPGVGGGSGSGATASNGAFAAIAGSGLGTNTDFTVPEPATIAILGFAGLLGLRRRNC